MPAILFLLFLFLLACEWYTAADPNAFWLWGWVLKPILTFAIIGLGAAGTVWLIYTKKIREHIANYDHWKSVCDGYQLYVTDEDRENLKHYQKHIVRTYIILVLRIAIVGPVGIFLTMTVLWLFGMVN